MSVSRGTKRDSDNTRSFDMAHNVHLLNNMNLNPETLELATSILREASVKTKPGSGFELGPYTTGLPAICAYIASKRCEIYSVSAGTARMTINT